MEGKLRKEWSSGVEGVMEGMEQKEWSSGAEGVMEGMERKEWSSGAEGHKRSHNQGRVNKKPVEGTRTLA